jgi:hypothetical protein
MAFLALIQFLQGGNCKLQREQACEVIVNSGRLFAILATVAFIITVDSFDSLLNNFGWRPDDEKTERDKSLKGHFYDRARLARYVGVSALIFCGVLLVAMHDLLLASAAIGIVFVMGWNYWFPKFTGGSQYPSLSRSFNRVIFFWALMILPLFLRAIYIKR